MEKPVPPGQAEDIIIQQYPSPVADGQAYAIGAYFAATGVVHQLEQQQMDQLHMKNEGDRVSSEQKHHRPEEQHGLRPSVSADADADDLQLAARLTEGLAPMMAAAAAQTAAAGLEGQVMHHSSDLHTAQDHGIEHQEPVADGQLEQASHHDETSSDSHDQTPKSDDRSLENHDTSLPSRTQTHTDGQDVQMQDTHVQDPNLEPEESGLHSQDPGLEAHDPHAHSHVQMLHHDQRQQGLGDHDPNLHDALPPEQQQQQHQEPEYVDIVPPQPHIPAHLQMTQLAQQAYNGVPVDSSIPPRKRSKVSRACDECRRKKVKCDAISETGETACSNCRRSQVRCDFSRIPQKRGPSKGYIKELADRINSIEGKLGNQSLGNDFLELAGGARRESSDAYSPSVPLNDSSKRPYSNISGDAGFSTPITTKQGGWSSEPRPIHPYPPPAEQRHRPPYTVNNLAPRLAPAPEPQSQLQTPSRPAATAAIPAPMADVAPSMDGLVPSDQPREIDNDVFNGYLTIIHPTFPFLASVKTIVQSSLAQCPPMLQDAFLEALISTMQSFRALPPGSVTGDSRQANRWLAHWEADCGLRSYMADLVHFQTLLLLAIEADNHGPASPKGQHGRPSKFSFLARAVAVTYSMSLRDAQLDLSGLTDPESDPESEDKVALRAWWSLVAMDRFNAIGTAQSLLIPQSSILVTSPLKHLLGEAGFQFVKLCYILGYYTETYLTSPHSFGSSPGGSGPPVGSALSLGLNMWQMDFPDSITPSTHPVLHFAYWHCRMLSYLFVPSSKSTDLMWATRRLLEDLTTNQLALSPLNHNFTCLTALCLVELGQVDRTREEAKQLIINDLLGASRAPSTWDVPIRERISAIEAIARPATASGGSAEAVASQGLQHLADLAAATTGLPAAAPDATTKTADGVMPPQLAKLSGGAENYEDLGFDPRPLLRGGYLNYISAIRPGTLSSAVFAGAGAATTPAA